MLARLPRVLPGPAAQPAWGSVALAASLLTIPVAGTALYIMDQYLTPRDLSTAGIMLVIADALERRSWRAGLLILLIAAIHPLMSVFGIGLLIILYLEERRLKMPAAACSSLPSLQPVSSVYRDILDTSDAYFLVVRWQWYEWLGIFAPLASSGWTARYTQARGRREMAALSRALIVFGLLSFAAALVLCIPRLAGLALLQPMRSLHLIFILLFVLLGGILAESVLKTHAGAGSRCSLPFASACSWCSASCFPPRNTWNCLEDLPPIPGSRRSIGFATTRPTTPSSRSIPIT